MSVYDIGRICIKTLGREAGHYCIIVEVIDKNYLLAWAQRAGYRSGDGPRPLQFVF